MSPQGYKRRRGRVKTGKNMIEQSRRSWLLMAAAPLSVPLMLATLFAGQPLFGPDTAFAAGLIFGVGVGLALLGFMLRRTARAKGLGGAGASPGAMAEYWGRFRNRAVFASVLLFLASQGFFYTTSWRLAGGEGKVAFSLYDATWAIWSLLLTLFLATGGGFFKAKGFRRLLNDEVSIANRQAGRSLGFFMMIGTALGIYGLKLVPSLAPPITLDDAIHGVVTVGISAAMLRYGWLERQADRAG